jgi:eukaryotic-like serine/threonine-protein kinase
LARIASHVFLPLVTSPPTIAAMIFGGRYAVERPLGSGATATVYLCRDRTTMKAVAVKVLSAELAESVGADRFLREIRLTAGLDHPAILPVIDSGADGNVLYFVLPYMEGGTLRDQLREKKQLPISEAVAIGTTICEALAYAHGRGLIHRDIKPENILFHQGRAYLGDFGIARVLHATGGDLATTTTGVIRGTPAYMSPEQASGEREYDGRSDIYSLGCVMYEMISGMPPFVGPTSQSVMAQRFATTPREMRVYRSSVSPELEKVVAKSMMMAPADRFDSAQRFAEELRQAAAVSPKRASLVRLVVATGVTASLLVAAGLVARRNLTAPSAIRPDTTQLVVLPFARDAEARELGSVDALVYHAFSAWQGVSVVEPFRVRDILARQAASGVAGNRSAVVALGAGRFVRGEIASLPARAGWRVQAWLHQIGERDSLLHHASVTITPADLGTVDRMYARLANTLLLRGRDSAIDARSSTSSLPAMQAFAQGIDSLDTWNLSAAESQFARALEQDPLFNRARFWQAQVRAWRRQPAAEWAPLVFQASADSMQLPRRERRLALALNALGRSDFSMACADYKRLSEENATDFAAWYGLGQCNDQDNLVVPDGRGGLRYRSSYQEAMRAYQRAFGVLAVSYRGVQREGFEPLQDLLYLRPGKLRSAVTVDGDRNRFIGRLDRDGDTLVMRVIPVSVLVTGGPRAVPTRLGEAIELQRALFRQIVTSWSTALPKSGVAKEGVAISLEMSGDRSALDTIRVARSLAEDAASRLRLAVSEVIISLKHLERADLGEAARIRRLADSLLSGRSIISTEEARLLAPVAVLTARCALATRYVLTSPTVPERSIPIDVVGQSEAIALSRAMRCAQADTSFDKLRSRITQLAGEASPIIPSLLARAAKLASPFDSAELRSVRATDYLAEAQVQALRGNRDSVRRLFASVDESRRRTGTADVLPDAVYGEARVLLAIGDTSGAIARLDQLIAGKARLTPGMLTRPIALASLMRSMDLRAGLGQRSNDSWRPTLEILWSGGDSDVRFAPR